MRYEVLLIGSGFNSFTDSSVKAVNTYKKIPIMLKPLRFLSLKFNVGVRYWVSYDYDDFSGISTVILFDCENLTFHTRAIEKLAPTSRLIIYFWNPMIMYNAKMLEFVSKRWELWTFDYSDAKQYHMKYGGQFLFESLFHKEPSKVITSDLFFIGLNKGRFDALRELESILSLRYGIKTQFIYVDKIRSYFDKNYSYPVPYENMVQMLTGTRAILDYTQKGQTGLTLRILEGLILGKKIVTNNASIKNYDFYDESQIFVLGDRPMDEISLFLNSDARKLRADVISRYFSNNWLKRIIYNHEICDYLDSEDLKMKI